MAGHVGVGVNSTSTVGLYPKEPYSPLSAITGTPGEIKKDDSSALACKTVATSKDADKRMSDFIARAQSSSPTYRVVGNSCVNFVQAVLNRGGVYTPPALTPAELFKSIPGN